MNWSACKFLSAVLTLYLIGLTPTKVVADSLSSMYEGIGYVSDFAGYSDGRLRVISHRATVLLSTVRQVGYGLDQEGITQSIEELERNIEEQMELLRDPTVPNSLLEMMEEVLRNGGTIDDIAELGPSPSDIVDALYYRQKLLSYRLHLLELPRRIAIELRARASARAAADERQRRARDMDEARARAERERRGRIWAEIFRDHDFFGPKGVVDKNSERVTIHNNASSIRVYKEDWVIFYSAPHYGGAQLWIKGTTEIKDLNKVPKINNHFFFHTEGTWNDAIASARSYPGNISPDHIPGRTIFEGGRLIYPHSGDVPLPIISIIREVF